MNRMGRPDDERIFVKVPSSAVGLIIGRGISFLKGHYLNCSTNNLLW